jgi:hypothetical protein
LSTKNSDSAFLSYLTLLILLIEELVLGEVTFSTWVDATSILCFGFNQS